MEREDHRDLSRPCLGKTYRPPGLSSVALAVVCGRNRNARCARARARGPVNPKP